MALQRYVDPFFASHSNCNSILLSFFISSCSTHSPRAEVSCNRCKSHLYETESPPLCSLVVSSCLNSPLDPSLALQGRGKGCVTTARAYCEKTCCCLLARLWQSTLESSRVNGVAREKVIIEEYRDKQPHILKTYLLATNSKLLPKFLHCGYRS